MAEYADPEHPVHEALLAHRQWFLDAVTALPARVGNAPADRDARHSMMLRDGAMASGCLSDPGPTGNALLEAAEGVRGARRLT